MIVFALAAALLGQPSLPAASSCVVPAQAAACLTPVGQPHPAVKDGAVLIGMGETMVISLDENGGNPQLVATGAEAKSRDLKPGELRIEMSGMGGTMLSIQSNHGRWLNYRARMGLGGGQRTSVCTIMAGKGAFESWGQGMKGLTLDQFTPAPEGEMVCR